MSELVKIGKSAAVTTEERAPMDIIVEEGVNDDIDMGINTEEAIDGVDMDINTEETIDADAGEDYIEDFESISEEGFAEDFVDEGIEDGMILDSTYEEGEYMDPGFDEGYIDSGFYEEGFIDPGMETGMSEVKDPLLSSWPFVIGISAAVLIVSIALGALLAKLKIKKGIDLYED